MKNAFSLASSIHHKKWNPVKDYLQKNAKLDEVLAAHCRADLVLRCKVLVLNTRLGLGLEKSTDYISAFSTLQ